MSQGTIELLDQAVAAARKALPGWASMPDEARRLKIDAVANLIEQHRAELSEIITLEQGKPQSGPGANLERGAALRGPAPPPRCTCPRKRFKTISAGKIVICRKPVGVVGSITPWNWPLLIATWHIMPALRVGAPWSSSPPRIPRSAPCG